MNNNKNRIIVPLLHIMQDYMHFLIHCFIPLKNIISWAFHSGKIQMIHIIFPLIVETIFNGFSHFQIKLKDTCIVRITYSETFISCRIFICPFLCIITTHHLLTMRTNSLESIENFVFHKCNQSSVTISVIFSFNRYTRFGYFKSIHVFYRININFTN